MVLLGRQEWGRSVIWTISCSATFLFLSDKGREWLHSGDEYKMPNRVDLGQRVSGAQSMFAAQMLDLLIPSLTDLGCIR